MFYRFIIGIILVIISVLIAYLLNFKYSERKRFFDDLYVFTKKTLDKVSFSNETINESNGEFSKYIENPEVINENKYLTKQEKEYLVSFFSTIGRTERKNETEKLKRYLYDFSVYKTDAEKEYKKKTPLYIKLGFYVGILLLILII